jgi:hypothetical protein
LLLVLACGAAGRTRRGRPLRRLVHVLGLVGSRGGGGDWWLVVPHVPPVLLAFTRRSQHLSSGEKKEPDLLEAKRKSSAPRPKEVASCALLVVVSHAFCFPSAQPRIRRKINIWNLKYI